VALQYAVCEGCQFGEESFILEVFGLPTILVMSSVFEMVIDPGRDIAQYLRFEKHCKAQLSAYIKDSNAAHYVAHKSKSDRAVRTIAGHELLEMLQFFNDGHVEIGPADLEGATVSVALVVVFDHDGVVQIITHVFGFVGFDAHFGLFAEPLPLAGEGIIAVCSVVAVAVAVGCIDDCARRRRFVCWRHDVGPAALPGNAVSRRIVHAA
jgi:hypothetical protein